MKVCFQTTGSFANELSSIVNGFPVQSADVVEYDLHPNNPQRSENLAGYAAAEQERIDRNAIAEDLDYWRAMFKDSQNIPLDRNPTEDDYSAYTSPNQGFLRADNRSWLQRNWDKFKHWMFDEGQPFYNFKRGWDSEGMGTAMKIAPIGANPIAALKLLGIGTAVNVAPDLATSLYNIKTNQPTRFFGAYGDKLTDVGIPEDWTTFMYPGGWIAGNLTRPKYMQYKITAEPVKWKDLSYETKLGSKPAYGFSADANAKPKVGEYINNGINPNSEYSLYAKVTDIKPTGKTSSRTDFRDRNMWMNFDEDAPVFEQYGRYAEIPLNPKTFIPQSVYSNMMYKGVGNVDNDVQCSILDASRLREEGDKDWRFYLYSNQDKMVKSTDKNIYKK